MVSTGTIAKLWTPNIKAETRARIMGKLSTHTHECPRCGAKWECGEANYQDECPYPIKTLCTKCWAKETPKDRRLGDSLLALTIEIRSDLFSFASRACDHGSRIVSSDGGQCSVASCGLHRLGHLRRILHARPASARGAARCHVGVWNDHRNLCFLVSAHCAGRVA